jgi:nitrogen fixation protein FixH
VSTIEQPEPELRSRGGAFWAMVPAILLGAALAGLGVMASIATHDPGFALETDYYQRAVHWDDEQAQQRANERLGYRLKLAVDGEAGLSLELGDRDGKLLRGATVTAEAFSNARAALRHNLRFTEAPDGTYRAALAHARPGLWEFRINVLSDGQHFTMVERADVPKARGAL